MLFVPYDSEYDADSDQIDRNIFHKQKRIIIINFFFYFLYRYTYEHNYEHYEHELNP